MNKDYKKKQLKKYPVMVLLAKEEHDRLTSIASNKSEFCRDAIMDLIRKIECDKKGRNHE